MRLILVDDSAIVREGLTRVLTNAGHDVVESLGRPELVPAAVQAKVPDAVVLDIRMPPTYRDEGLCVATALRRSWPDLGILVLSSCIVADYLQRLLRGGEPRTGYLLKDRVLEPRLLSGALEKIVAGGTVVDPELIARLAKKQRRGTPLSLLTGREREVLHLLAEGMSDRGIADRLVVSTNTVGTHIQHVFRKLGLPEGGADNRRVLAVLKYISSTS